MPENKPKTVAEYDELLLRMSGEVDRLKDAMRKIRQERDRVEALESAEKKVAGMSDAERAAMAQAIGGAGNVPSHAGLGTPGTPQT
jgi:hypothetical protein